jgi:hypothetical protein
MYLGLVSFFIHFSVIDSWSRKGGGKGRAVDAGVFFFFGSLTKIERSVRARRKRAINIIVDHLHLEKEESSCRKNFPEKKEVQTSDAHHDDQQKLAGYRLARFEVRCK